jgi:hypothetical protein
VGATRQCKGSRNWLLVLISGRGLAPRSLGLGCGLSLDNARLTPEPDLLGEFLALHRTVRCRHRVVGLQAARLPLLAETQFQRLDARTAAPSGESAAS